MLENDRMSYRRSLMKADELMASNVLLVRINLTQTLNLTLTLIPILTLTLKEVLVLPLSELSP